MAISQVIQYFHTNNNSAADDLYTYMDILNIGTCNCTCTHANTLILSNLQDAANTRILDQVVVKSRSYSDTYYSITIS